MTSLVLHHASPSRSSVVLWMLEEVGEPYEVRLLSLDRGEHKAPDYLALNPMGKVPTVVHDGVPITEVAAICCYLADTFPAAGLAPPIGDPRRGPYLKWLFFGPGCLEPAIVDRMHQRPAAPPRSLGYGDFETTLGVVERAVAGGPYLLGQDFSAADIVIGANLRWAMFMKAIPERPALAAYVARLAERPALKRATAKDEDLRAGR